VASNVARVVTEGDSGSLGRVIYVIESPLSKRDVERFGMLYLRSRGFKVEAWNVAPIYLPATENQWIDAPDDFLVRRFRSEDELCASCRSLTNQDKVILMSGVFLGQRRSHRKMIQAFSKSSAILGAVTAGHSAMLGGGRTLWETVSAYCVSDSVIKYARNIAISILRHNSTKGTPSVFGRVERWFNGLRALDFIWAGTSIPEVSTHVNAPSTVIRIVNSFDFEIVRDAQPRALDACEYALYLDDGGCEAPDIESNGIEIGAATNESFFAQVRLGLDRFESELGIEIQIAAHPRTKPGSLEPFFGGRVIRHQETGQAMLGARVVITPVVSTAIGMAVCLNRPIIIITSTKFVHELIRHSPAVALLLKVPLVDIDAEYPKFEIPEIDEMAYAHYMKRYVKRADSIDLPFWEVVARDLGAEPVN